MAAQPPAAAQPPTAQSVTAQSIIEDVGTISYFSATEPRLRHTFLCQTTSALVLTRLVPACACLQASPDADAGSTLPLELSANQKTWISVTLDLKQMPPGRFEKSVLVFARPAGSGAKEMMFARLTLRGILQPALTFAVSADAPAASPILRPADTRLLSLGVIDLTASRPTPLLVTVTPDARLLSPALQPGSSTTVVPPLLSDSPALNLSKSVKTSAKKRSTPGTETTVEPSLRYRLTIAPDAPLGPFQATVAFAPAEADQSAIATAWRSTRLVVRGNLVGEILASPPTVAFGFGDRSTDEEDRPAPATRALTMSILLTVRQAGALEGMRIETGSPLLKVTLVPANSAASPATNRTLLVTLPPEALTSAGPKSGFFQSQVILHLRSGRRLVLPVSAFFLHGTPDRREPDRREKE